jgi:hypothetical protein
MNNLFQLLFALALLTTAASAADLTIEVQDEDENRLNADFTLKKDGNVLNETSGSLERTVQDEENYTLIQQIDSGPDVSIYNLSITQNLDLRPQIYTDENPEEEFLTDTDPLYFIDQSFDFSSAEFTVSREQPDSIARCTSITENDCSEWNVQDTSQYENSYTGSTFRYNVTLFSGYTSGQTAPLPEIENIQIYNVSSAENQKTGGNLVDEGLNETLRINQKNSTEYRFNFTVLNNGSEPWTLTTEDKLEHRVLNRSWSINETDEIFYTVDGTEYTGGTFSSGEVEWSTGDGEVPVGETLNAQYIVNISQDSTNTFDQVFNASTSSGTTDTDRHEFETLIYGFLDVSIDSPENNSVIQNNREFTLNGTVSCQDGDCGEITAEPRHNTSTGQQRFTGAEFEVREQNSTCKLLEDQNCTVNWSINATAQPNTFHELDYRASSEYTEIEPQDTVDQEFEIRDILLVDLDWNSVEFGVLDPGERRNPAWNNSGGYNVTVEEDSNTVDNLWLKASELVSEKDSNYTIAPGNMTWAEENSYSSSTNFTRNYSLFDTDLTPGTTKNLHYWLNVPYGILNGEYRGTISFKANQTQ